MFVIKYIEMLWEAHLSSYQNGGDVVCNLSRSVYRGGNKWAIESHSILNNQSMLRDVVSVTFKNMCACM